ncbi:hypothetical protein DL96DRAFT_1708126 [Flagelloscypha sp. PMI_526]|nr:hypothetical protein DL96DRAFT_1708126 [Flagelloscypha sp. PMI_526]
MTLYATETRWDPSKLSAQPFYQVSTDEKYLEGYVVGETGIDGKFNYGGSVPVQTLFLKTYYYQQLYTYPPSPTPTSFDFNNPSTWVECYDPSLATLLFGTETPTPTTAPPSMQVCYSVLETHNPMNSYATLATQTVPVMAVGTIQQTLVYTFWSTSYLTYGSAATSSSSSSDSLAISGGAIAGVVIGTVFLLSICIAIRTRTKTTKKRKDAETIASNNLRTPSVSGFVAAPSPATLPAGPTPSVTATLPVPPQIQPPVTQEAQAPLMAENVANPTVYEQRMNMMQEEIRELREQLRGRDNVAHDPPPNYSLRPPTTLTHVTSMAEANPGEGFRVLSLDGPPFAAAALSEPFFLQQIAHRWAYNEDDEDEIEGDDVRVSEMFDIIGGSGIGGLNMTIGQVIKFHNILQEKLFTADCWVRKDPQECTKAFDVALDHMVSSCSIVPADLNSPFFSKDCKKCYIVVLNETKANTPPPRALRTYKVRASPSPRCTIRQALHATLADLEHFPAVSIGDEEFMGASSVFPNASHLLVKELAAAFPNLELTCFVNLGADCTLPTNDSHRVGQDLMLQFRDLDCFFRLSLKEELHAESKIISLVMGYLQEDGISKVVDKIVNAVKSREPIVNMLRLGMFAKPHINISTYKTS